MLTEVSHLPNNNKLGIKAVEFYSNNFQEFLWIYLLDIQEYSGYFIIL